jgi:biotin operon repressor
MQEGQLLMTQADRDRLVALKKAKKKLITQREAAEELGISVRHVKRLIYAVKKHGDKAVVHGLRGRPSNRRIEEKIEARGDEDLVGTGLRWIRANAGGGVLMQQARDRGEQGDGAAVDDAGQVVAGEESESERGPHVAAATEPVRRVGAMGYQRSRVAGGPGRETVPDRDDR